MKCTLIIDSPGPNPDYDPPQRKDFVGPNADEDYADAKATYDVSPEVLVPAGTLLSGRDAWMHCYPDETGIAFKRIGGASGKVVPFRKSPGIVRAVPADEACQAALDAHMKAAAAHRGVDVAVVAKEVAAGVARSKALQATADAQTNAPAATSAS
jgi:hypothetical protein